MLKKVALSLGVLIAVFLGFVATRPNAFHVERTAVMMAPPKTAFALVNDFHNWAGWSPWEKLDPAMKKVFEGAAAGTGAGYYWNGNDQVGEGRMTITESKPDEKVLIKLKFLKPFPSTNVTTFSFAAQGQSTRVTWAMDGEHNFFSKAFSLVKSMDAMIGKDFEKGLQQMKDLAESDARRQIAAAPVAAPAP
jgi:hypothetical protein